MAGERPMNLVWGELEENAVFAEEALVLDLVALRSAMNEASTWGEFRRLAPAPRVAEIEARLEDWDEPLPADDAAFEATQLPGYGDGDWPEWLHQEMLGWMPRDVRDRYGSVEDSVLNGEMLQIPAAHGEAVAVALAARGFTCRRDDDVIAVACGH